MLEYPESRVVAAQIARALTGKTVEDVIVSHSPHKFAFYTEPKEDYPRLLKGRTVLGAHAVGGQVVIDFQNLILIFSDGAYPRYRAPGDVVEKHQLLLGFTDGCALSVSIQMYGGMRLENPETCDNAYYLAARDKPDPLGEAFSYDDFRGLYAPGAKLSVKAFLATEQRIPGLGNGVLQDILWNAGLDPRRDMRTLEDDDFKALYDAVRATLSAMVAGGGRATEKDFFGNPGRYPCRLCKDTLGTPCLRCGAPIEKAAYMGGAVYFCPKCQKR